VAGAGLTGRTRRGTSCRGTSLLDFKPRRRLLLAGASTASAARRLGGDHRPSTIDHWPSTGVQSTAGVRLLGWYSGAATGGGGSVAAACRYRPQRATAPTKCIAKLSRAKGGGAASRSSALMAGNMEPHAAGTAMSAAAGPGCSCGRTGSRMRELRRHGRTNGCAQVLRGSSSREVEEKRSETSLLSGMVRYPPVRTSARTKYISLRGAESGKRARTAGRNSEIQGEHSGGEMGYKGANIWLIRANEGWC
jgi:hypothetical protein